MGGAGVRGHGMEPSGEGLRLETRAGRGDIFVPFRLQRCVCVEFTGSAGLMGEGGRGPLGPTASGLRPWPGAQSEAA